MAVIEFRTASEAELSVIVDWAAEEGWNPGLSDVAAFFQADPEGFFVATHDGTPIASISVVKHTEEFAFLGLYIVRPEFRGQGHGYGLWQHALSQSGSRVIGLDGVPDQQANYAASGFVHAGGTTRYSGFIVAKASDAIRAAKPDDIATLIDMEASSSGVKKAKYLDAWFTDASDRKSIVIEREGVLAGACTVRACRSGSKIGPLLASHIDDARDLIHHAASLIAGDVTLDVPNSAQDLVDICKAFGMTPGFETARMYRGSFSGPKPSIFAVPSLELG